jgi:dTDP-4-dehydrorhamnose reductase
MQKLILTGSGGMLGKELQKYLANYFAIFPFDKKNLDITNAQALKEIFKKLKPDFCVNAAAYTAVDLAETEQTAATTLNAKAVGDLAQLCQQFNIHLTHFSTDYVFDGNTREGYTEDAATNPINFYGVSKLAGEKAIQASGCDFAIIRTSWLFGDGKNFVNTMLELSKKMPEIKVVSDQIGCPTSTKDLAKATTEILRENYEYPKQNRGKIFHLTNSGETSWANFARKIFKLAQTQTKVIDIPTSKFPTPAKRPQNSILLNTKLSKLRNWENALEEFLHK